MRNGSRVFVVFLTADLNLQYLRDAWMLLSVGAPIDRRNLFNTRSTMMAPLLGLGVAGGLFNKKWRARYINGSGD